MSLPKDIEKIEKQYDLIDATLFSGGLTIKLNVEKTFDVIIQALNSLQKGEEKGFMVALCEFCRRMKGHTEGCPNDPSPQSEKSVGNWEERFDETYTHLNDSTPEGGYDAKPYVKNFIQNLLHSQKEEMREKIRERNQVDAMNRYENGYNEALSDILDLFK